VAVDKSGLVTIVNALVTTEEAQIESLVFRVMQVGDKFYIALPEEYDPFSPYRTPWLVRVGVK
jgi:hypothetical protein